MFEVFGKKVRKMTALSAVAFGMAASPFLAHADTAIKFSLDWKFEGPSAPLLVALEKGYYKAEGLDVTIDTGKGSLEAIPRVASGTYQMGSADINSLIKFRDQNPTVDLKGIFMIYDAPPFAIIGRKSLGVSTPKDLEGKILGAPAPDGAYAQWPLLVKENGIDASKVTIENVGFPVREPMLAAGKVHAITGFSFSSFINLKSKGVAEDDISLMLMSDYGLDLYGNTILVNPDFAKENPEAVKAFLRATVKGFRDVVADPEAAVEYVLKYNDIARKEVELERLKMALRDNIVTDYVLKNGIGNVDVKRLSNAIDQIGIAYKYTNKPSADAVFTDAYLGTASERMVK
jgi:NitT/TauT family transport system substrate-binding protein